MTGKKGIGVVIDSNEQPIYINSKHGPFCLVTSGLIWTIAGMRGWCGLWWLKRWGAGFTRGLALVFSLYTWLERLFLLDRPAKALVFQPILPANWIFLAGLNILLLIWVFWSTRQTKREAGKRGAP